MTHTITITLGAAHGLQLRGNGDLVSLTALHRDSPDEPWAETASRVAIKRDSLGTLIEELATMDARLCLHREIAPRSVAGVQDGSGVEKEGVCGL